MKSATFTYVTPKNAGVFISLVTKNEGETGSYDVRSTLDGKVLTPDANGTGSETVVLE